jgi:tripartite-type tricarboxylate transporter receptor subunit TctC
MKLPRRRFLHLAAGAAALPAASRVAWAQSYPSRQITMIVPFAAGGPADTVARVMAERMRASLGQMVIIENVAGAGGSIGVGRIARATPDGYTFGMGISSTQVVNPVIYTLPYDVMADFEPITLIASNPHFIVAKKANPANNLKEFIAWLKANPDKATAGTAGNGSPPHLGAVFFQHATGTRFGFVPYRGGGPAMQDLVAGQIDMMVDAPATVLPQLRAGTIKVHALAAKSRLASAPNVPTTDEAGLPGFHFSAWFAFFAPKGTPKPIIDRLNAAAVESLADKGVRTRLAEFGLDIYPREQQTPQAVTALHKAEIETWWPIIKAAKIKGD